MDDSSRVDNVAPRRDESSAQFSSSPSEQLCKDSWKSQSQVVLLMNNIPKHWMIADLKAFLNRFGSVVKVEIFEDIHVPQ